MATYIELKLLLEDFHEVINNTSDVPLSSSSSLFLPLDIGGRSALGFGYHVSRPLLYTYRSSALLACAIFLTALNTALTEISERFPARQHFPVSDRECSK